MKDKNRIKQLEEQLEQAKRNTYIYETNSLWCNDGELYMQHGDNNLLVFDVENFYKDLPTIIEMVVKENKKQQEEYIDRLKKTITNL